MVDNVNAQYPFRGDGMWLMTWRNLVVMSYTATPSLAHLDAMEKVSLAGHKEHPGGLAVISISARPVGMPDAATRKRSTAMMDLYIDKTIAVANVLEGDGFWGATARSVMVGITALSRARYPQKVFSNIGEGAVWMAQHLKVPEPADGDAVRRMVEQARSEHLAAMR